MKFSGFMNGCGGKILTIILSIVFGVVLALGGIVGGGYVLLTKKGMLIKAEELAATKGITINFEDTLAQGSMLDYGKQLVEVLKNTSGSTIGSIESLIGISAISNTLNQMLGIDQAIIKEATISNIGATISSNLTMSIAQQKFGITFPDMPLFKDEEFLAKPIGQAFGDFDEFTLGEVITIGDDSHAALKALRDIAIKDIGGSATTESINGLCLCELMTIGDTSSQTLKSLKYCTIDSTYTYAEGSTEKIVDINGRYVYATKEITITNPDESTSTITVEKQGISDKLKELKISDVITITDSSHAVLRKMRTVTQEELDEYIIAYLIDLYTNNYPTAFDAVIISDYNGVDQATVDAMSNEIKAGFLNTYITANKDISTYCDSYNALVAEKSSLYGTEDLLIEEMGGSKFTTIINNMTIGELIPIDGTSEPILIALKDTTVGGLNAKMQVLQLDEIFSSANLLTGPLSLIDSNTTLPNIPSAMTTAIQTSTLSTLRGKGVVQADTFNNVGGMPIAQRSFIYNSTVSELLKGMINFIAAVNVNPINPTNFDNIRHPARDLIADLSYASLTDFTAAYQTQYSRVSGFEGTVNVTVGIQGDGTSDYANFYNEVDDCYYIPLFNLVSNTSYNFLYSDGITVAPVKLAIFNIEGSGPYTYTLATHQYGYYYAPNGYQIDPINTNIIFENS